jgi:hypothetical protein
MTDIIIKILNYIPTIEDISKIIFYNNNNEEVLLLENPNINFKYSKSLENKIVIDSERNQLDINLESSRIRSIQHFIKALHPFENIFNNYDNISLNISYNFIDDLLFEQILKYIYNHKNLLNKINIFIFSNNNIDNGFIFFFEIVQYFKNLETIRCDVNEITNEKFYKIFNNLNFSQKIRNILKYTKS